MRVFRLLYATLTIAALTASSLAGPSGRRHRVADDNDLARPTIESMAGTWVVSNHEGSYKDVRAVLSSDGVFHFRGAGWSSGGTFRIRHHSICLEWTEVDNEPVEPGTIKKAFDIGDDNCSFTIDTYRYRRLRD